MGHEIPMEVKEISEAKTLKKAVGKIAIFLESKFKAKNAHIIDILINNKKTLDNSYLVLLPLSNPL